VCWEDEARGDRSRETEDTRSIVRADAMDAAADASRATMGASAAAAAGRGAIAPVRGAAEQIVEIECLQRRGKRDDDLGDEPERDQLREAPRHGTAYGDTRRVPHRDDRARTRAADLTRRQPVARPSILSSEFFGCDTNVAVHFAAT
jgi:hypothetical protein